MSKRTDRKPVKPSSNAVRVADAPIAAVVDDRDALLRRYVVGYHDARFALTMKQMDFMTAANDPDLDPLERNLATQRFGLVSQDIKRLDQQEEDFLTQFAGPEVDPPDPRVIAAAEDLSKQVARLIAMNRKAEAVLKGINAFLDAWGQLVDGKVPAIPAAPD